MHVCVIIPVCSILCLLYSRTDCSTTESEDSKLIQIVKEVWLWRMMDNPRWAVGQGYTELNGFAENDSLAMFDVRKAKAENYRNRLVEMERARLSKKNKVNYDILFDMLNTFVEGYKWRLFSALNPINFLEGIHTGAKDFVQSIKMNSKDDYTAYIMYLEKLPQQFRDKTDRMKKAIELKHTSHNVSVNRVPEMIESLLVKKVGDSVFYTPFLEQLDDKNFTTKEKKLLRDRASKAVENLIQTYRELKDFLEKDYMPNTRKGYGVGSYKRGKVFYKACLKWHLSTDLSPKDVHKLGKSEVSRIHNEMTKTISELGYNGSVAEFFSSSKTDSRFKAKSKEHLLQVYDTNIDDIRQKIDTMFKNYPGYDIRLQAMETDQGFGMYRTIEMNDTAVGVFYVNLFNPAKMPLYSTKVLTVHETIPGHHLQMTYILDANIPTFRRVADLSKYYQVPFHFPFYTAYAEGWALYAEFLGEEMGLYKDKYELMGRYISEIFRATRLVVDTGIHYYGWSKEKAMNYMLKHTGYERQQIELEVDRYITWPGQACSYKVGELKIKELRRKAEDAQGDKFDIKEFHAILLENGGMPLRLLEKIVDDWIEQVQSSSLASYKCSSITAVLSCLFMLLYIDALFP